MDGPVSVEALEFGKRLVFRGDRRFEMEEWSPPAPGAGEALVAVSAAGICGSDVHGFAGVNARRRPGTVMGHEVSGRVVVAGDGVDLAPGTQVALWPVLACGACDSCQAGRLHLCRQRAIYGCDPEHPGGFATMLLARAENLIVLPATVPTEWGALAEPLAVGHHALTLAPCDGASVLVLGGGPIGIAAAFAAVRGGASDVAIAEPVAERRETMANLGLRSVAPEDAPTGVEIAVECVGSEGTLRAAVSATRPGGTVICVGLAAEEATLPMVPLVIEERRLLGSSVYTRRDFQTVVAALDEYLLDLGPMIERRVRLSDLPVVFEEYANGDETAVKTLVTDLA